MTSVKEGFGGVARAYDDNGLIYIPVVFHLLYRDSIQYVSDAQVQNQLDALNADFSLSDSASVPAVFRLLAADTRIRFCLAALEGNSSIRRKIVTEPEIGFSDNYYQTKLGGLDPERTRDVLNIWVTEIQSAGDVAGFSTTPSELGEAQDGIVIDYRYFGSGGTAISPFDLGRTLTHEVGHWLGLRHIWGNAPGCDSDDLVEDTPVQYDRYRGCPSWPQTSCGSDDMFMNFMDLTDDACMALFTTDQKMFMRGILLSLRSGVASDDPCEVTTSIQMHQKTLRPYPNPFDAYIQMPLQFSSSIVTCYSIGGRQVFKGKVYKRINTSEWRAGLYLITVQGATQSETFKMLKVR